MASFKATVVSLNSHGRIVVKSDETEDQYVIARKARNRIHNSRCNQFFFGAVVQVHSTQGDLDGFVNDPMEPKFSGSVTEFSYDDVPSEYSEYWNPQIVAVVETTSAGYIGVVSSPTTQKHWAVSSMENPKMKCFTFAIGYPMRLKSFHFLEPIGQNLWMNKNAETELSYKKHIQRKKDKNLIVDSSKPGAFTYYNLRPLTEKEIKLVHSRAKDIKNISLQEAETFIRDPIICSMTAEYFVRREAIRPFRIEHISIEIDEEDGELTISIVIPEEKFRKVTDTNAKNCWRFGSQLSLKHEAFWKEANTSIIYQSYSKIAGDDKLIKVNFMLAPKSFFFVKLLFKTEKYKAVKFTIAPTERNIAISIKRIIHGFPDFFKSNELFDVWRGHSKQVEQPQGGQKYKEYYEFKGSKLNDNQLQALTLASKNPGFCCVSGLSGSGKSHLVSAIVKTTEKEWLSMDSTVSKLNKPQFAVCTVTNEGVMNTLKCIHEQFPEMKICQDISHKFEEKLDDHKLTKKIGIRQQIERNLLDHSFTEPRYLKMKKMAEEIAQKIHKLDKEKEDFFQGLQYIRMIYGTETEMAKTFLKQLEPTVYGTTADMIHRADSYRITRLIIEEGSILSVFHALALYCTLPNVTHITLLGDPRHSGPDLLLPRESELHFYLRNGELSRLGDLGVCSHVELTTVYCVRHLSLYPKIQEPKPTSLTGNIPKPRNNFIATLEQSNAQVGSTTDDSLAEEDAIFEDKLVCAQIDVDRSYDPIRNIRTYTRFNRDGSKMSRCKCFKVPCRCDMNKIEDEETKENSQKLLVKCPIAEQFNALFKNDAEPLSWKTEPKQMQEPAITQIYHCSIQ